MTQDRGKLIDKRRPSKAFQAQILGVPRQDRVLEDWRPERMGQYTETQTKCEF